MRWSWALVLLVACSGGDDGASGEDTSSDDASVPDGGPCGIAGGPLVEDQLSVSGVGTDDGGLASVRIELHPGGTCIFDEPSATVSLRYSADVHLVTVSSPARTIVAFAQYRDERYWWDALGVDAQLVATPTHVTAMFHDAGGMATTTCTHADGRIICD